MNWLWSADKAHFLLSDDKYHLMSGWHTHGTGGSKQKRKKDKTQAQREDAMLLGVIKQFMQKI